jgi:aryl-alcohol dehydrogenase-like predicted oxidoreductase
MRKIALGKTGIEVSVLCLGCMYFGSRIDDYTSRQLLDCYFEAGGRFLDTSNNYAFWIEGMTGRESETLLGRWMKERKNRDQLIIATKVGANPTVPGTGFETAEGLSSQAIKRAVEGSLRRLNTDYIDLYYAHIDDRQTPLEETLAAFNSLIKEGKVRAIGCSNIFTWRIEQARTISSANGWAGYCAVQQRYSYFRPRPGVKIGPHVNTSEELLDYCQTHDDLTLLAFSPLLEGAYVRKDPPDVMQYYSSPDTDARMQALTKVSEEIDATRNQTALAWLMQVTPRAIPLIAASNVVHLQENIASEQITLSQEQLDFLSAAQG